MAVIAVTKVFMKLLKDNSLCPPQEVRFEIVIF